MVLSNKKLKQKLRAAKAELLAKSEAQIHPPNNNSTNPEDPTSTAQESLESLLDMVAQKPRLSKREKRRKKSQTLQDNADTLKSDDGDGNEEKGEAESESVVEGKKKKRKRKTDDGEGTEAEEVKKVKKKKKKNKKKGKKEVENAVLKESSASGDAGRKEQGLKETAKIGDSLEACTKIYVGGIPYYSSEDDIRSYFEGCGTVAEIDCMKFPESGKFRGIAIINFKTEAAAKRALALDGSDMGGLFLKLQPYKSARVSKPSSFSPAIVEGYNRIYVGNLSWEITEDDLRKLFSGCTISSVRFGEDKETREFRGYAHVDFSDSVSVNTALKMDQKVVCGRPVRISCAVPKKGSVKKTQAPAEKGSANEPQPPPENSPANGDGVTAVTRKIRRRTCYECGERGHLSSCCPKKQAAEQTNLTTS